MSSLGRQFMALLQLELKNSLRSYPELLLPVGFFILLSALFALTLPDLSTSMATIGASSLWLSALLAILLSMDRLFLADYQSGHLKTLCQSRLPLCFIIFIKICNHWLTTLLPLILMSPLVALFYHLPIALYGILVLSISIGSVALISLNALGSALTVGLNHRGILLTLLMIPLQIPIILFGTGVITLYENGQAVLAMLALLGALSILSLIASPFLCAFCLRVNED